MIRVSWCLVWLCVLAWLAPVRADRVYTWEDDGGVVHFSDQPPGPGQKAAERWLDPPKPIHQGGPAEKPSGDAGGSTAGGETGKAAPSGPARVVVTSQMATPVGPRTRQVSGEVKNTGGETASGVTVFIRITDAGQGTECTSGEVDVEPDSLEPGDTGKFEEYIETPCFLGNAGVDITPDWN